MVVLVAPQIAEPSLQIGATNPVVFRRDVQRMLPCVLCLVVLPQQMQHITHVAAQCGCFRR